LSISTGLVLINEGASATFGKLGKIQAGLSIDAPYSQSAAIAAMSQQGPALQQLPPDLSLVNSLFDPSSDPLPPALTGGSLPPPNQTLQLQATISPPIPLEIIAGKIIYCGVWMFPSLLGQNPIGASIGMGITPPNYTMVYDDGLG
jgi:hypothetical protein